MKQFQTFTLLFLFSLLSQAQIVMEQDDLPVLGTNLSVGNTVNPDIDILSPGTGLIWDFSDVVPGAISEVDFLDIAGTDGEADFMTSAMARLDGLGNILGINISDLFAGAADLPATAYFSYDADGNVILDGAFTDLAIPGFPGGPQGLQADPDVVYLPLLQYGQSLSDNGRFEIDIDLDSIIVTVRIDIEREFDVDAWGTLELPDFSYDVLRIQEISSVTPLLGTYLGPIFFPIPGVLPDTTITVESYSFITKDIGFPIATARTFPDSTGILSLEFHVDSTTQASVEAEFAFFVDCLDIEINDNSLNASNWNWDFGDGNFSSDENPTHSYAAGGDYTITLIASNSSTSDTIMEIISVVDCDTTAAAEANFSIIIDCLDIEVNDNSVNATNWNWDFGDGNSSSDENPMHTYATGGDYTLTLIASNTSSSDTISETYSIMDCDTTSSVFNYEIDYELYPNPTDGELTIRLEGNNMTAYVSNLLGERLYTQGLNSGDNNLDLSDIETGLYFISILNDDGAIVISEKLMIR